MANAELLDLIRAARQQGQSDAQMVERLAAEGWQPEDVHGALAIIELEERGLARPRDVEDVPRSASVGTDTPVNLFVVLLLLVGVGSYLLLVELPGHGLAGRFLPQLGPGAERTEAQEPE